MKQWLDRWTCDRCGVQHEAKHEDGYWPQGWRRLRWAEFSRDGDYCPPCSDIIDAALKPVEAK